MPRLFMLQTLFVSFLLITVTSCSPVKFSSENQATVNPPNPPVVPQSKAITCAPRLNGTATAITMDVAGTNPVVTADCTPTSVNYAWTVSKNGTTVAVSGLTGATSQPDFGILGPGTYLIYLEATATDWDKFELNTPLSVTVTTTTPGTPNIVCTPRLNGSQTSVVLGASNPTLAGNCNPSGVAYAWTVTRAGTPVTIAGLNGSSSTPDFLTAGPGTYLINLTATLAGYNPYSTPGPLTVVVPASPGTPVVDNHSITFANNMLDILLVVDDSSSMLADNQRLAARLTDFVDGLSSLGFDWQMCLTVTRAQAVNNSGNLYWGASNKWESNPSSPSWILKSGTANTISIFQNTINRIGAGWAGTDDERAIKAAYWHAYNGEPNVTGSSGCYRSGAGLAVLILSDEDERSIGGDQTQVYYASEKNKALTVDDLPAEYIAQVKKYHGNAKRLTVNSIIVKPGDSACLASQDAEGSKAHYGVHYAELSNLTNGHIGSICDSNFSTNLKYFKDSIVRSQASVTLKCAPVGPVTTTVTPNYAHATSVSGTQLTFNPAIPAPSTVKVEYTCP